MNIKRLFIITGTVLLGLSMALLLSFHPTITGITFVRAAGPWYVTPDGSDSNSCQSPGEPCETINGAIGKASGGDTIFVAAGEYNGTGIDFEVVLLDKSVTLSGGWDSGFTTLTETSIIDCEDMSRGIYVNSNVTTTIDSFTVKNGYAKWGGGGIYNSGTLTLTNSTISDNRDIFDSSFNGGGGIYNIGTLTLINSTVNHNTSATAGGGIFGDSGSLTVIMDSKIHTNSVDDSQGGGGQGGGIEVGGNSHLYMARSWVVVNSAYNNDGGGISVRYGSATIENSIIAGNYAGQTGGGLWFGGEESGPYRIVNSHIVGNEAYEDGAAISAISDVTVQVEITNTLIISNTGNTGIDSQWDTNAVFLLFYCDTYGNSPDGTVGVTITRQNCLGTPPEDGLDPMMAGGPLPSGAEPMYADQWLSYDYRLLPGSPAIDAGTPTGAPPTDIEGNPRDATPDMGAYEYIPPNYIYLPLIFR